MGARNIRTILDVSIAGYNLRLTCRFCGRVRVMCAGRLYWAFQKRRWRYLIDDVPKHVRCAWCGRKDVHVAMTDEPPGEGAAPRAPPTLKVVPERR